MLVLLLLLDRSPIRCIALLSNILLVIERAVKKVQSWNKVILAV